MEVFFAQQILYCRQYFYTTSWKHSTLHERLRESQHFDLEDCLSRRVFVSLYLYVLRPWHQHFSGLQGCLIISKVALGMINHPNKVTYWLCKKNVRALNMYVVLPIMFECLALFMNDKIPITKGYAMKRTLRRPFSCRENKPLSLFSLNELCESGTGKPK